MSNNYNPMSVFNKIQKTEQARANDAGSSSAAKNPLIFKPKVNTTITCRLLWLPPAADSDREYPMINSYVHNFYDELGTKKFHQVVCPTSQYMMGETRAAFDKCPICTEMSSVYNNFKETGSTSAKELYDKFKRKCMGYIPVYIINGPDDVKGQVKILSYGKQFKDFFDAKIFGITKPTKNGQPPIEISQDEIIGLEAFMYQDANGEIVTDGYDLVITTASKRMPINGKEVDMPTYSLDFSRRKKSLTEIEGHDLTTSAGEKYFEKLNDLLSFDKDFYIKSTDKELQEFKTSVLMKDIVETSDLMSEEVTSAPAIKLPKRETIKAPADEEEDVPKAKAKRVVEDEEEEVKPKAKAKAAPIVDEVDELTGVEDDFDSIDVESLLAGLE